MTDLQSLLAEVLRFFDQIIVPALLALAGVFFIWNALKYFIVGGSDPTSQQKARSLALWGLFGFAIIISLWGIVTFIVRDLNLDTRYVAPDYMCERNPENCVRVGTSLSPNNTSGIGIDKEYFYSENDPNYTQINAFDARRRSSGDYWGVSSIFFWLD